MANILGFLIDQMLPSRLVDALREEFPTTIHVREAGLVTATDREIAEFADKNSLAILTKDSDFDRVTEFAESPKKVVRIAVGNIANDEIVQVVQTHVSDFREFLVCDERLLVVLRTSED